MCTAAAYVTKDFYFGRTLDYDFSYGDEVVVTPRNFPFHFKEMGNICSHYAMIGMAHVEGNDPLYYDAVNEKGLGMAGLNFVGNACYHAWAEDRDNVAQYELIPWILSQCATAGEAEKLMGRINLLDVPFSESLPLASLHWMISDRDRSIVLESVREGVKVYENPVGILTNNPAFDQQLFSLNHYMNLSPGVAENRFSPALDLQRYSRGMGAIGLPGDLSSQSRFVRASFVKMNSISRAGENESVSQFFHILGSVDQQWGCCRVENGAYEYTIYTSCCNATKGIYYYTSYDNHQITAVHLHREQLDGRELARYPRLEEGQIFEQNVTFHGGL